VIAVPAVGAVTRAAVTAVPAVVALVVVRMPIVVLVMVVVWRGWLVGPAGFDVNVLHHGLLAVLTTDVVDTSVVRG
jgi:hypothetical protein